jgi:uncharacterized protein YbaP (TraB family)
MLPAGENLRAKLGPDERAAYESAMDSLGLAPQSFDAFKPWYAAMNLSLLPLAQKGWDSSMGVETVILSRRAEGSVEQSLETLEYQIGLFDGLPEDRQIAYLNEVVQAVPTIGDTLDAMTAEWLEGDADALAALMNAEMADPVFYERLLTARNANWAAWIDARMDRPGTVFMAVGAGHLAGKGSVQDKLAERGFVAERVE